MGYTIKQIAEMAGLTTRTLRHFDQIGLLRPRRDGRNHYRNYDQDDILRLQQILFFRELAVPLKDIKCILDQENFNLAQNLCEHRERLLRQKTRTEHLIHTIDATVANLIGEQTMTAEEYFDGFEHGKYEAEAETRWGDTSQFATSQKRWKSYSQAQQASIKEESRRIIQVMVGSGSESKPDDVDVQQAVGGYLAYIDTYFYPCDTNYLRNLADMWADDTRFRKTFEKAREGGADFAREAVLVYCGERANSSSEPCKE